MSRKNQSVNRIVQGSNLYSRLSAYDRKILVNLLKAAYSSGKNENEESDV